MHASQENGAKKIYKTAPLQLMSLESEMNEKQAKE